MKRFESIGIGLILLITAPVWSQTENTSSQSAPASDATNATVQPAAAYGMQQDWNNSDEDRMQAPPVVNGQAFPVEFTSEERSNYLRFGVLVTSAYTDNATVSADGQPVSDVSYSVAPSLALDDTTVRLHTLVTYAPGFTLYQRTSSLNQTDQNATIGLEYRLSPHVTFSARDNFLKSSSVFNQQDFGSGDVSGGAQAANFTVIAPLADFYRNAGNVGLSYQFSRSSMVGVSGTFTTLHYSNQSQVPGLSDASSQGGLAFCSLRVSRSHYLGITYQYQRLVSQPTSQIAETQTHAAILFYSFIPSSHLSFSIFGGPQHANTVLPPLTPEQPQFTTTKGWTPSAGASAGWQGHITSLAVSYTHVISGGSGLIGAVQLDSANVSVKQRITRSLNACIAGTYAQNDVLGTSIPESNGHSIIGTSSLQQQFGQRLNVQLGYSRLRQDYGGVSVISQAPNTNREFVSILYQFSRALGR
jgi:hypothetical protein